MIAQQIDSKKEPLAVNAAVVSSPKFIRVVAPSNLPGGYQVAVQTDNEQPITFMATVPMEGVKAGEVFLTPPPPGYASTFPQVEAPIGRWKDGLCDCFNYGCCHAQLWLSFLCPEIAMGQVMQRMRLTWLGGLVESHSRVDTFKTVLIIVVCYNVFSAAMDTYLAYNADPAAAYYGYGARKATPVSMIKDAVSFLYMCWSLFALCQTRRNVRRTYSIPEQSCSGCEDCLCSTFCTCCTIGQIARHTGEYEKYPSLCCTETGLPDHAPSVV